MRSGWWSGCSWFNLTFKHYSTTLEQLSTVLVDFFDCWNISILGNLISNNSNFACNYCFLTAKNDVIGGLFWTVTSQPWLGCQLVATKIQESKYAIKKCSTINCIFFWQDWPQPWSISTSWNMVRLTVRLQLIQLNFQTLLEIEYWFQALCCYNTTDSHIMSYWHVGLSPSFIFNPYMFHLHHPQVLYVESIWKLCTLNIIFS